MGYNIQPAIEAGLTQAPRVELNLGINPRNGLKTHALINWTHLNYQENWIMISMQVSQYVVLPDTNEVLVNRWEYVAKADNNTRVDYEGNVATSPETSVMTEWEYLNYIRNTQVHIPTLEQSYITRLFDNAKLDKPKEVS